MQRSDALTVNLQTGRGRTVGVPCCANQVCARALMQTGWTLFRSTSLWMGKWFAIPMRSPPALTNLVHPRADVLQTGMTMCWSTRL